MKNLDFLEELTDEELENLNDKINNYFTALENLKCNSTELHYFALIENKYPTKVVISNPFIWAEYHGYCNALKEIYPRLTDILTAENDLLLQLLEKDSNICF